jgi:hypothetical protein
MTGVAIRLKKLRADSMETQQSEDWNQNQNLNLNLNLNLRHLTPTQSRGRGMNHVVGWLLI